MKKTLVIGMGKSGVAVYDFLQAAGDLVVGLDDNHATVQRLLDTGVRASTSVDIQMFDRVVLSPGVSPQHRLVQEAEKLGLPMIGEMQLAFEALQPLGQSSVAITGTNGKTTVTLLITHILQKAGLPAYALGNVGVPLTSYVRTAKPEEMLIVELSSYQLDTLYLPIFDVGLILNITPDHLDRYGTMRAYAQSKCRLQACLKKEGTLWVHESVALEFKEELHHSYHTYGRSPNCTLWTDQVALLGHSGAEVILPAHYKELGFHESENVLAAWIACKQLGIDANTFLQGLQSFQKPKHRIEWVASIKGVDYINDSKGTNIDATIKAVQSIKKPLILIAGGVDKGASYQVWKTSFKTQVRYVIALGAAASKIAADLGPDWHVKIVTCLAEAVALSYSLAEEGDAVLLSPGCSSYDMFRDYAHRGDEFKQIVEELKEKKG